VLPGKCILLTGASGGIGRALVSPQASVRLALAARRHPTLEQVADEIAARGYGRPLIFDVDLSPRIGVFGHLPTLARLDARLLTRDAEQAGVFIDGSYGI